MKPPAPAASPAVPAGKEEITVKDAKVPKEVLAAKAVPVSKEPPAASPPASSKLGAAAPPALPKAPPPPKAVLGAPPVARPPAAFMGARPPAADKTAANADKTAANADKIAANADKPAANADKIAANADKPAANADKPAMPNPDKSSADKPGADKPAAAAALAGDKAAPAEKPGAAPGRLNPPERRRALEDSVVTSAPKLPPETAARAPGAPRSPAKAAAKTAPAGSPKQAAAAGPAEPDKDKGKEKAKDKALTPATPEASGGVPALRQKRDRNKSPGFYSSVSPAHGAQAVTGPNPFAPGAQPKKPTVVGLAPPPEPVKGEPAMPAEAGAPEAPTPAAPAAVVLSALAPAPAPELFEESGKVEFVPALPGDPFAPMTAVPVEDAFAPPQPCSTPPASVSPIAREEKEETSPGLGQGRAHYDPNLSTQVSGPDLDLLLAFALDLALGCASPAWFVPLRAAVGRLIAGDAALRNSALEKALTTLHNDLEQPDAFSEENRQRLYGHVVAVDLALSKRMDVTGQKAIRERLIVDQLLDELSQAHPMLSRRIKDQGLVSLESLGRISPTDLSLKLETPEEMAVQVASLFQGYLDARVQRGPSVALLGKAVALKERLTALEASAEAFELASEGEDSGARRQTRKQRQTDVTQLNLLLAEFGEAKTLAEIERCSVQAKIQRLQRWIGEQEVSSGRRANKSSSAP